MKRIILLLTTLVILSNLVSAADIHGAVYSISLKKVQNIVIEIDSLPTQRMVSKSGDYNFKVAPGKNYTIQAKIKEKTITEESLFVPQEGDFIVDLFVFPDFSEDDKLVSESDLPVVDVSVFDELSSNKSWIVGIVIILVIIFVLFTRRKKNNIKEPVVETNNDPEKIIEILKKEGGRMNQKELRKHFPLSEAKVSLMIAELEAKGKIEKIKQGRGNILILKN